MNKWIVWLLVLAVLGFGGYTLYQRYSTPLIGEAVADQGRVHQQDISGEQYNSNPPTSGNHFPIWAKRGVYDRLLSDGYLIHSLEHGYVVISYDCTKQSISNFKFLISNAFAHEGEEEATSGSVLGGGGGVTEEASPSGEASGSGRPLTKMRLSVSGQMDGFTPANPPGTEVELSEQFKSDGCKALVGQLGGFYDRHKSQRLIVIPRVGMDTPIALTAWNRILKLSSWEEQQAALFLDQWENKGPERPLNSD